MRKHVTTIEEAIAYMQADIDGVYDRRLKKAMIVKASVVSLPLFIFGIVVALLYKSPLIFVVAFAISALIFGGSFFTSHRSRELIKEEIRSGAFFEKHNAMDVIRQANDQIDIYNQEFNGGKI